MSARASATDPQVEEEEEEEEDGDDGEEGDEGDDSQRVCVLSALHKVWNVDHVTRPQAVETLLWAQGFLDPGA